MNHVISNLRDVLGSGENVRKLYIKSSKYTASCTLENMILNIALLKDDYGIDIDVIRNTVLVQNRGFLRNPEFFRNVVVRVEEELGIPRDPRMFVGGINLLCFCCKKNVASTCKLLRPLGRREELV